MLHEMLHGTSIRKLWWRGARSKAVVGCDRILVEEATVRREPFTVTGQSRCHAASIGRAVGSGFVTDGRSSCQPAHADSAPRRSCRGGNGPAIEGHAKLIGPDDTSHVEIGTERPTSAARGL